MKERTLNIAACQMIGHLEGTSAEGLVFTKVAIDSRCLSGGELFFAMHGERDGHEFIQCAAENGAIGAVVERPVEVRIPQIIVENTLTALGNLAGNYRKELSCKVIAITGSIGKTTTRELTAHCLSAKFFVAHSKKNFNNLIGLPLSILEIEPTHEIAVLELGINCPGEMARLARIACPDFAVITNIAPVHLEGLKSLDNIAVEKLGLLELLSEHGLAFLCADDPRLSAQKIIPSSRVRTFGFNENADFRVSDIWTENDGHTGFEINGRRLTSRLFGRGAAYSAACAVAVCSEFGISLSEIEERIEQFEGVPGRMTIRRIGDVTVIEDCYNSSPMAVKQALQVLKSYEGHRKIAVLGDMLELGDSAVAYHEELGSVAIGLDALFLYGDLIKAAIAPAVENGFDNDNIFYTNKFDELVKSLQDKLRPGDVLLLKASRALRLERVTAELEGATCVG